MVFFPLDLPFGNQPWLEHLDEFDDFPSSTRRFSRFGDTGSNPLDTGAGRRTPVVPGIFRAFWLGGRLGRRSDDAEATAAQCHNVKHGALFEATKIEA